VYACVSCRSVCVWCVVVVCMRTQCVCCSVYVHVCVTCCRSVYACVCVVVELCYCCCCCCCCCCFVFYEDVNKFEMSTFLLLLLDSQYACVYVCV
jgi:hypothetical protein